MPEGKEQYGFDAQELSEWLEWQQSLLRGHVKQDEAVQRQGNGQVVDEREVHVPRRDVEAALVVEPVLLQDDGQNRRYWLDKDELEHSLLHVSEENPTKFSVATYLSVWRGLRPSRGHGCLIRL